MFRLKLLFTLISLLSICGCAKEYSGWNVYYNSKIEMQDVPPNSQCPNGGVLILTGLDKNQNDKLDSVEIDQTKIICHGSSGNGTSGLNSKISFEDVPSSLACPAGGVIIKAGIDKNQNGILDASEVDETKTICHGASGSGTTTVINGDKQILIDLYSLQGNTTSSVITGVLPFFSKLNYPGVDSIVLIGRPYIGPTLGNTSTVELYNLTDGTPVNGCKITGDKLLANTPIVVSPNCYASLPDKPISLGMRFTSADGTFAGVYSLFLYLYRK